MNKDKIIQILKEIILDDHFQQCIWSSIEYTGKNRECIAEINLLAEEIHKLYEEKLKTVEIDLKHLNTKIQSFRSANSKPDDSCLLNWKEHINQIRDILNPPKKEE